MSSNIQTKQARGITDRRAVVFVGIMLIAYVVGAGVAANADVSRHLFSTYLYATVATWVISCFFPAGWFNMKRTAILAVVVFGGLLGFLLLVH
jgi:hypothetical protein